MRIKPIFNIVFSAEFNQSGAKLTQDNYICNGVTELKKMIRFFTNNQIYSVKSIRYDYYVMKENFESLLDMKSKDILTLFKTIYK